MNPLTNRTFFTLLFFTASVVLCGMAIGLVSRPDAWFSQLQKPAFNPPSWVFGPVWTVLYILIGVAGWRVWQQARRSLVMKLWWAQMALNYLWSPAFFGAHSPGGALVVIIALLAVILAFIYAAWRLERTAAMLFLPYAAWVSFATVLNVSIVSLN